LPGSSAIDTQASVMLAAMIAVARSRLVIMANLRKGDVSLPSAFLWLQYAPTHTFGVDKWDPSLKR
jgi:hypothetical protein